MFILDLLLRFDWNSAMSTEESSGLIDSTETLRLIDGARAAAGLCSYKAPSDIIGPSGEARVGRAVAVCPVSKRARVQAQLAASFFLSRAQR